MLKKLSPNWNLDEYFPGGSQSPEFKTYISELHTAINNFTVQLNDTETESGNAETWQWVLTNVQEYGKKLRHASSFVACLAAQNTQDRKVRQLAGQINIINAAYDSLMTMVEEKLLAIDEVGFNNLFSNPYFQPLKFNLSEIRSRAKQKLSATQENLINDLSIDGYHAWSTLYGTVAGNLKIPVDIDGSIRKLSPGQAANLMTKPDRELREKIFTSWEDSWAGVADYCAIAINGIAGFRLNIYKHRHWDDVMAEPLELNRMSRKTIETMWQTIDKNKKPLVDFLQRKKELLGVEKLSWHDYTAPIGNSSQTYSLDEAATFIIEHVSNFSPTMGRLVTKAFSERWVETEDRDNKRAGAFCSSSPIKKQSRVFMTFSGSVQNVATMAHELGHAYHQSVMNDLPPMSQRYAMNVAETASTFSEMVVADASLKAADSTDAKIALLNGNLQRAVSLLMNIQSRYIFENNFYQRRQNGFVSVAELNELMVDAQKDAFNNALDIYHPHFWASKLHFYNTRTPFYNFPYTFGFLFSAGVYSRALSEGPAFEEKYINLLRDTGRMRAEDLANKHLGVDLEQERFWQDALDIVLSGLGEFMELTSKSE